MAAGVQAAQAIASPQQNMLAGCAPQGKGSDRLCGRPGTRIVLGRYAVSDLEVDILYRGSASVVLRGEDVRTGREVAVKSYEPATEEGKRQFKRHVAVAQWLSAPLEPPEDGRLWCAELQEVTPEDVFVQLLDHSTDEDGLPGEDSLDGGLYVVTELAQCSLQDCIWSLQLRRSPLAGEELRGLAGAIILAAAALHSRGLVHLDLKPENFVIINGKLKLARVECCVPVGQRLGADDGRITYTPSHCAPELAGFTLSCKRPSFKARWSADVWSVGMTVAQLACFEPLLDLQFARMTRGRKLQEEPQVVFHRWLAGMREVHLPLELFDGPLACFLSCCFLRPKPADRLSLAQCLSQPYFSAQARPGGAESTPWSLGDSQVLGRHGLREVGHVGGQGAEDPPRALTGPGPPGGLGGGGVAAMKRLRTLAISVGKRKLRELSSL